MAILIFLYLAFLLIYFYQYNLLPIEELIEWNDDDIIYDLLMKRKLNPTDTQKLLLNGTLDIDRIKYLLAKSNMTEMEKMDFIFCTFDIDGDENASKVQDLTANEIMEGIQLDKQYTEYSKGNKHRENQNPGKTRKLYVTSPFARWRLISKVDPAYQRKLYSDGFIRAVLPNTMNGIVVFEKLYKKTRNGTRPNNGTATYWMTEEEFYENEDDIIKNDKVSSGTLVELGKRDIAHKCIHNYWEKNILEDWQISSENGYSKEQLAEIEAAKIAVTNSRREISR